MRSVDSIITGLHEPRATHLSLLEQVIETARRGRSTSDLRPGKTHLERAYAEAMSAGYLWHEFGDAHLIR